jgi:hypothetical protein
MSQTFKFLFGFRCVALLYALSIIELNVEVSDTTGDAICTYSRFTKYLKNFFLVEDIGFEPMTLSLQS